MAHLFEKAQTGRWAPHTLSHEVYALSGSRVVPLEAQDPEPGSVILRSLAATDTARAGEWAVIDAGGVQLRVNGLRLETRIRVLRHGDEIRLVGSTSPYYYSTERPLRVELFAGREETICPRCQQGIEPGRPSVRCAGCDLTYHQDVAEKLPCWTGDAEFPFETCQHCGLATALDAGLRWTPDDL